MFSCTYFYHWLNPVKMTSLSIFTWPLGVNSELRGITFSWMYNVQSTLYVAFGIYFRLHCRFICRAPWIKTISEVNNSQLYKVEIELWAILWNILKSPPLQLYLLFYTFISFLKIYILLVFCNLPRTLGVNLDILEDKNSKK